MTLEEMKQIDPASVDRNTLVDITEVEIDPTLPREELLKDYLAQIRNPYLFRCGDVDCGFEQDNLSVVLPGGESDRSPLR